MTSYLLVAFPRSRRIYAVRRALTLRARRERLGATDELASTVRTGIRSPLLRRREFLQESAAAACGFALGACVSAAGDADGLQHLDMQLGWLAGGNQLGEVVAKRLGFFEAEGIRLVIRPGGPHIDGVGIVASGRYLLGQVASSPSLMLAVSQGIPIRCFGVCVQEHPYSYFSLPSKPVREPKDMIGKKIGTNATGRILLDALLAKHEIDPEDIEVVVVGSSMMPLLTGQVDVITGWTTNVTALKPLGPDRVTMRLWDQGIRLYAMPYYATLDTLEKRPGLLEGFLRAAGRGWELALREPERAVGLLVEEYPILRYEDELVATHELLGYVFTAETRERGWATMNADTWREQIETHDQLGQFTLRVPTLEEIMTLSVLDATSDARPRLEHT
jgi:NitT/TauT family transport system substrate-binding protein